MAVSAMMLLRPGTVTCPFCGGSIYGRTNETFAYLKLVAYVVFWFGLLLLGLAVIFSRSVGFRLTFVLASCLWVAVVGIFTLILSVNILVNLFQKHCFFITFRKTRKPKDT